MPRSSRITKPRGESLPDIEVPPPDGGMFQPVRTRRSFEEALEQIVERIKTGDLKVGDRIPSERDIAASMGISRPTLRAALKLLATSGVIEVRARSGGMYVASDLVPTELLVKRSEMVADEIGSVLQARRIIETNIAQIAGRCATDADLEALQKTVELQSAHSGEHLRLLQLDERFHLTMARATHNPVFLEVLRLILRRMAVVRDMTPRTPADYALELAIHKRTLEAIASRDPVRIDTAMDEHMSYLEKLWEQETGNAVPTLS